MRKTRNKQIMTIAVVMVGIVGLAVGFAAFSTSLSIKSNASVTPDASDFSVVFSSLENTVSTEDVSPLYSFTSPAEKNATANKGQIDNSIARGPKMTNLQAHFTEPGQTVTYEFYVRNEGEYLAYLNNINIGEKTCEKTEGSTAQQSLVTTACNAISVSVKVGSLDETDKSINLNSEGITHTLDKTNAEKVIVTLTYASDGVNVDGPFNVKFGNLELIYSTVQDYVDLEQGSSSNQNSSSTVKDAAYYGLEQTGMFSSQPLYSYINTSKAPTGMLLDNGVFAYNGGMSGEAFVTNYKDYLVEFANYVFSTNSNIDGFYIMYNSDDTISIRLDNAAEGLSSYMAQVGNYYIGLNVALA